MEFVQIIAFDTSRIEDVKKRRDQLESELAGSDSMPPRVMLCADRDTPNRYMVIAEFPDYETAMANSSRPEVTSFAQDMGKLCDGPPTFYNLDLVERM